MKMFMFTTLVLLLPIARCIETTVKYGVLVDREDVEFMQAVNLQTKRANSELSTGIRIDPNTGQRRPGGQSLVLQQDISLDLDMNNSFRVMHAMCGMMKARVYSLLASSRLMSLNTLRSYSREYRMPLVATGMAVRMEGQELGYDMYMRPLYAQAIFDVIKMKGWRRIHYVYSSFEALHRMEQLQVYIVDDGLLIRTSIRHVTDGADAARAFSKMYHKDDNTKYRVVLDLPASEMAVVLRATMSDPWHANFHFLLGGLDIDEIEDLRRTFPNGGVNVTGLRLVDPESIEMEQFSQNWRLNNAKNITHDSALAVDAVSLIAKALSRVQEEEQGVMQNPRSIDCEASLENNKHQYGYIIMKAMREMEFKGLTGKVAFDEYGLRKEYALTVREMTRQQPLDNLGTWTAEGGYKAEAPKDRLQSADTYKKTNYTYKIVSILSKPFLSLRQNEDPDKPLIGNDRYEGFCAELASLIAEKLDFQYEIKEVEDGKYGAKDDNGTWNGMVGELVAKKADICIAPLTITAERENVIDFSKPFMGLGISIMIRQPKKKAPGVFSFMYPLSGEIWMCVIFAYIGVSVVLFLVSRFSPFEWHVEDNTDGPSVTNNFTIFNSLWFSLGAFMQQGCDIEPRSMSGRIVGSVWWFFTLIIISSYTANLAAFLTVERMQSPIESADDLAKQTEIKYGSVESGSTTTFFRTSSIPVYERMWSFMQSAEPSVFVSSNDEGIRRVRTSNGKYAFLAESSTIEYHNQQHPCDTIKVGSNLDSKGYGIATPIGSPIRNDINLKVLELRENGELRRLENKWWYTQGDCGGNPHTKKKDDTANSLQLSNVAGLFYILFTGLIIAATMAVIEFIYKSHIEARRRNTTFMNALRTKARLSIKGKPDSGKLAMAYKYPPAAQLVSLDGYHDANNAHTSV